MVGSITFSGLGSGIDTASIIEKLMEVERFPVRNLEASQSDYKSQLSIVRDLNSRLQALQTATENLKSVKDFLKYDATSANEDALTATATGSATPGTYDVEIISLASAERTYSDAFAAKDVEGVAGEGTLSITVGTGTAVDIEILATDTLEGIMGKINSSSADVTAGLLYTGSEYKLQISGNKTGAANAITFAESGTLIMNLDDIANQYRAAADASIKVDDVPISSASNSVGDAIPGVTLDLLGATTGKTEVRVEANREEVVKGIDAFVAAYNRVSALISGEFSYTGEAKGSNRLAGDATLRSVQRQLGTLISSKVEGVGDTINSLSQIGIATQRDGSLKLDSSKLDSVLASNMDDVAALISGTDDSSVLGVADLIDNLIDGFIDFSDGSLKEKENGLTQNIDRLGDQILSYESRLAEIEQRLVMQFTEMELTVSSLSSQVSYLNNIYQGM